MVRGGRYASSELANDGFTISVPFEAANTSSERETTIIGQQFTLLLNIYSLRFYKEFYYQQNSRRYFQIKTIEIKTRSLSKIAAKQHDNNPNKTSRILSMKQNHFDQVKDLKKIRFSKASSITIKISDYLYIPKNTRHD